jgi:hypothetical protein
MSLSALKPSSFIDAAERSAPCAAHYATAILTNLLQYILLNELKLKMTKMN